MNVAVVVPSYNPDEKMVQTVKNLIDEGLARIVVVNDGSMENCKKYFDEVEVLPQVSLLVHDINRGKGRAMKTAFQYILENEHDVDGVVTVDADGQHKADDIKKCVRMLEENPDNIILGVRNFELDGVPAKSRFGNELTRAVFRLCGMDITDTQTGLRVIPAIYLPDMLNVSGDRYEYETQQLLEINRLGIEIQEAVIDTIYIEDNKSSHFNPIKDSMKIYGVIFKYIRKQRTKLTGVRYLISSLVSFLADVVVFTLINLLLDSMGVVEYIRIFGATFCARIISSVFNYVLNRLAVFKSGASIAVSIIKYYTLVLCQATASYGLVYLASMLLLGGDAGVAETLIKVVVDTVLFFISYHIQKKWVFACDR